MICIESSPIQYRKEKALNVGCTSEAKSTANTCAEKLWFVGRKSRKYPETDPELQKHCKQTSILIKCVKDYTDLCGNELHKQLANVMLFSVRTHDKSYCTKSGKKQEFMSLGVCGNHIRDQTSKCMDEFLVMLGKANAFESKFKVPNACWYVPRSFYLANFHNMPVFAVLFTT